MCLISMKILYEKGSLLEVFEKSDFLLKLAMKNEASSFKTSLAKEKESFIV